MTIRNEKKLSGMFFHNDEIIKSESLEVEHLDRIGAGDAFVAGTLHGILNNWKISDTLVFAVASFELLIRVLVMLIHLVTNKLLNFQRIN